MKKEHTYIKRIQTIKYLPWLVSLRTFHAKGTLEQFCGGTLIDQRHVLTAAHCVKSNNDYEALDRRLARVAFKDWNIRDEYDGQIYISIMEIILHSGINRTFKPQNH